MAFIIWVMTSSLFCSSFLGTNNWIFWFSGQGPFRKRKGYRERTLNSL